MDDMTWRGICAVAMVLLFPAYGYAESEYRDGTPHVMEAPLTVRQGVLEPVRELAEKIRRKGSPRVAIYWGREFGDEVTSQFQQVRETSVDVKASGHSSARLHRRGASASAEAEASGVRRDVRREERIDENTGSPLQAAEEWDLEAGFAGLLAGAGLHLVDPDVLRRIAARAKGSNLRDLQQLEMEGLSKHADYVLEVIGRRDASSESGWQFRVSLTRLANGQRRFDLSTNATPAISPRERTVASQGGGFERVRDPVTKQQVTEQLAAQVADRIVGTIF